MEKVGLTAQARWNHSLPTGCQESLLGGQGGQHNDQEPGLWSQAVMSAAYILLRLWAWVPHLQDWVNTHLREPLLKPHPCQKPTLVSAQISFMSQIIGLKSAWSTFRALAQNSVIPIRYLWNSSRKSQALELGIKKWVGEKKKKWVERGELWHNDKRNRNIPSHVPTYSTAFSIFKIYLCIYLHVVFIFIRKIGVCVCVWERERDVENVRGAGRERERKNF